MRRGAKFIVAVAVAVATLAGCTSTPTGVDGNLTDDWPAFAAPTLDTPVAGSCYIDVPIFNWIGPYAATEVPCSQSHWFETVSVSTFPDKLASRPAHPVWNSPDLAPLYQSCATRAADFLGGPWQTGYVDLVLSVPSDDAWRAGARWYACNVVATSGDGQFDRVRFAFTMRGSLGTGRPLLVRGCEVVTDDGKGINTSETAVDCARPHNAEFAGLLTLTVAAYPTDNNTRWRLENYACGDVFYDFLGIRYGTSDYFGFFHDDITQEQWNLGVRTTPCMLLAFDKHEHLTARYTGSIRGLRNRKPSNWTES